MDIKTTIGEGGRAPCNVAATGVFTGFQQLRATDLDKPFRRQSPCNQFALVVPNENKHTFVASRHRDRTIARFSLQARTRLTIQQENAPISHGRPAVSTVYWGAPQHRRSVSGKSFDNTLLAPHPIPLRPNPLRPIVRLSIINLRDKRQRDRAGPLKRDRRLHFQGSIALCSIRLTK